MFNVSQPVSPIDETAGRPFKEGVVKFFKQESGFGFLTLKDGTDLFFHVSAFRELKVELRLVPFVGNRHVLFMESVPRNDQGHVILKRNPQTGDKVHFTTTTHRGRTQAYVWVYSDDLVNARACLTRQYQEAVEKHAALPVYRLVLTTRTKGVPFADNVLKQFVTPIREEKTVKFEGNNVAYLHCALEREARYRSQDTEVSWECFELRLGQEFLCSIPPKPVNDIPLRFSRY